MRLIRKNCTDTEINTFCHYLYLLFSWDFDLTSVDFKKLHHHEKTKQIETTIDKNCFRH